MVERVSLGTGRCCVCGCIEEVGRCAQFEVCFTCYDTGLLLEWFKTQDYELDADGFPLPNKKEDSI
jgi:hypothetical protein